VRARRTVVAFDMIETVFSLEKLRDRLLSVGLPAATLEVWFAQTLRDAFALDATDVYHSFLEVASATLAGLLTVRTAPPDPATLASVLAGFSELDPHPDVEVAFQRLHAANIRIVALTNGSAAMLEGLLRRAALEQFVQRLISIEEIRRWKPRREVYLHAAQCAGVDPSQLALVATHAWDIHGAGRAGLTTAFVSRGKSFPATMVPPHFSAETLAKVAETLASLPFGS
jgi:2-haloacid dehalogenase